MLRTFVISPLPIFWLRNLTPEVVSVSLFCKMYNHQKIPPYLVSEGENSVASIVHFCITFQISSKWRTRPVAAARERHL